MQTLQQLADVMLSLTACSKKFARDFCRKVITIVPQVILQFRKTSLKIKANSAAEVLKIL